MINTGNPKLILAIEAAVRGGSVSLIREGRELVSTCGPTDISRAEDLLLNIQDLFHRSGTEKTCLDLIAVSNGPGSFTGIRIGLATAMGLANSLNIRCFGVSVLSAVANVYVRQSNIAVALPVGRNDVCWQSFDFEGGRASPTSSTQASSKFAFVNYISQLSGADVFIQPDLYDSLKGNESLPTSAFPIDVNLAYAIGLAARSGHFASNTNPFYVQNSRAVSDTV